MKILDFFIGGNMKRVTVCDYWIILLLIAIILFFSISYIIVPQKSFSEDENRMLQTTPRFTLSKLIDGTYTKQLHDYYSDQINLRTILVELKSIITLALGKNQNNGVLLAGDGYLIETDPQTEENYHYLSNNLIKIEGLMDKLKKQSKKQKVKKPLSI